MIELSSVSRFVIAYCDGAHPLSPSGELCEHEVTVSAIKSVGSALIEVNDFIEKIRSNPVGMVRSIRLFSGDGVQCEEWPVPPLRPTSDEDMWRFMVMWTQGGLDTNTKTSYFSANRSLGFPSTRQIRQTAVLFSEWIGRRGGCVHSLWGHDGHHWIRLGRDGLMVGYFRAQESMA
jgi:hypothetical protein